MVQHLQDPALSLASRCLEEKGDWRGKAKKGGSHHCQQDVLHDMCAEQSRVLIGEGRLGRYDNSSDPDGESSDASSRPWSALLFHSTDRSCIERDKNCQACCRNWLQRPFSKHKAHDNRLLY